MLIGACSVLDVPVCFMTDAVLEDETASISEVAMNAKAMMVVSLFKNVAAPREPNTVWLDPPNAAPISDPLPP